MMFAETRLRYKKLNLLIKQLVDKGFTDQEIEVLLESLAELSILYAEVEPLPKTIALIREGGEEIDDDDDIMDILMAKTNKLIWKKS